MIIPGPAGFQYATNTRHVDRGEAAREECAIHVRFGGVRRRRVAVGHGSSPPARQQHGHTQHHEITFPKHNKYKN